MMSNQQTSAWEQIIKPTRYNHSPTNVAMLLHWCASTVDTAILNVAVHCCCCWECCHWMPFLLLSKATAAAAAGAASALLSVVTDAAVVATVAAKSCRCRQM